jgi:hypothetical protein
MKVMECMVIWYFFISCGWNTKFHIPACLTVNLVSRWNELTIGTVRHAPLVTLPHDRQWNWWGRQLSWFDLRLTASPTARMYLTTSFRRAEVPSSRSATLNTAGKRLSQTTFHFHISLIITTNQMQVNVFIRSQCTVMTFGEFEIGLRSVDTTYPKRTSQSCSDWKSIIVLCPNLVPCYYRIQTSRLLVAPRETRPTKMRCWQIPSWN